MHDKYPKDEVMNAVTIQGLKTTIERLEESHVRKDERIKQLETELIGVRKAWSDAAWHLANTTEERIDW